MRDYRATHYPDETMEICQENIDLFFNFMNERHNIWHRRFIEKLPREQWTEDPILKTTKYTNIYRELDRGTLWWLKNIGAKFLNYKEFCDKILTLKEDNKVELEMNNALELKGLVWQTIIYRLCNRIETFEEVGFPSFNNYDVENLNNVYYQKLATIADRGDPVMTSAHLTCPTPSGYTKSEGFMFALRSLYNNLDSLVAGIQQAKSSKAVFEELKAIHCVGNFIAYEVLCDLMYVQAIPFAEDDWANVGPGAYEGIRLMYPSSAVGKQKSKNVYTRMQQLRNEQHQHFERLGIKFKFYEKFTKGHLSLRSIEHSLCEFSKYWLQRHSLGKVRLKFEANAHQTNIINGDSL